MNLFARRFRLILPLLLLAACARPDAGHVVTLTPPGCPPPAALALTENGMLRYSRCLSTLPPAKLAVEYQAVSAHFQHSGDGRDRIKLALLLSIPDTPFHNSASALRLLAPLPHQTGGVPDRLRDLADLLSVALLRQQTAEQRVHSLEKDLAAEKQHASALQAKIDSIKNLERTMTKRDAAP